MKKINHVSYGLQSSNGVKISCFIDIQYICLKNITHVPGVVWR